ncbi:MAG TPA: hypothetical protein DD490_20405 [Acidobacteria bacterium]|nr:hypothetical protein [Acidobacteriota bacterium]
MQLRTRLATAALALALAATGTLRAQDKPADGGMGMSPEQEKAMMERMSPGEMHKHLARLAGDWTFTNAMWMAPGTPPMESSGTMHAEVILGGRYVQSVWKGNFMGMPFEGHGTDGYDNVTKQYVNTWVDNMGTGIMYATGTCEDGGKKCTTTGAMSDAMSNTVVTSKSVLTWVDDNTFKNEMYAKDPSGNEFKTMEIVAKRK